MAENISSKVDEFISVIEQKSNSINNEAVVELTASLKASNQENLDLRKELDDLRLRFTSLEKERDALAPQNNLVQKLE
ncbi:hypothetical protein N8654_04255, partial [Synechococcus sp. AH-601-B19]|nr:hypothetical protein [Synechococcus sp. AH-601-B19]